MGSNQSWLTEQRTLTLLVVLCVIVGTLVVLPYLQYILLAGVLAYIFVPVQVRLERVVGPNVSALSLTALAVLMVIVPSIYILARAVRQGIRVLEALDEGELNTAVIEQFLAQFGYQINFEVALNATQDPNTQALQRLAVGTINIARGVPDVLIGLTITLFLLFTLLRDRTRLYNWTLQVIPVSDRICKRFFTDIDRLLYASVVGNVIVAAIQAVMFALGLWVLGLSNVIFLGVLTFILGVIPLIGVFAIWVPLSAYLFAVGRPLAGIFLVIYGAAVSVSDFYLRPAVIGHRGALRAATVVVGIFGGIVVFGAVGLFVGPVIIGGTKAAIDLYAEERGTRGPAS